MKKVIVIGCPGSGKSTFSRELQAIVKLPLYHLDMLYWNPDKTTVPKETFRRLHESVIGEAQWIIDGNFSSTMEARMNASDTVFFLDYPAEVCLAGVSSRIGKPRSDIPWIEQEEDPEFMEYIKGFNELRRPDIMALIEKYSDKNIHIFSSRTEASEYLRVLGKTE